MRSVQSQAILQCNATLLQNLSYFLKAHSTVAIVHYRDQLPQNQFYFHFSVQITSNPTNGNQASGSLNSAAAATSPLFQVSAATAAATSLLCQVFATAALAAGSDSISFVPRFSSYKWETGFGFSNFTNREDWFRMEDLVVVGKILHSQRPRRKSRSRSITIGKSRSRREDGIVRQQQRPAA